MKITQEEAVDRQTVLNIELEDEDLETYLDRGYRRVVPQVLIPGFRKGKAPRWRVEQVVGRESLLNEVLDTMLPELTSRAITEQDVDAAGLPRIELLGMEPFKLKATVPLTPDIDLGSYGDIKIPEEKAEYSEEDVQRRLEQLQTEMASWEPVERPAKMGDTVTMSAAGTIDGRTILDDKDTVFFLDEDGNRSIPDFAQNLEGIVIDEPKEFTVTMPDDYGDGSIAGKEAHFSVTVTEIKERILPELDEEFAKSVGDGYESIDALRQELEERVKTEAEQRVAQEYKESAVKALLDGATIELAPLMVEHEVEHMEDERERMLRSVNIRTDDYLQSIGKTAEEVRGEMGDAAVERLKRTFALTKVSELEETEVSDEEVDERIQTLLSETAQEQQVSDEMKDSVRRMLVADKTVDRLCAIARGEVPAAPKPAPEGVPTEEKDETDEAEEGDSGDDREA